MSSSQFKIYNRLAMKMDHFHKPLRSTWKQLYSESSNSSSKLSPPRLIDLGLHFCDHLNGHHHVEENYWYPILRDKMPNFRPGHFATEQHMEIHEGLDKLQSYLEACQRKESDLRREKVQQLLDAFGDILWQHLNDEVQELGAENMKKYWTEAEMRNLPL